MREKKIDMSLVIAEILEKNMHYVCEEKEFFNAKKKQIIKEKQKWLVQRSQCRSNEWSGDGEKFCMTLGICALHCDANLGIWILWQKRQKWGKKGGDWGLCKS